MKKSLVLHLPDMRIPFYFLLLLFLFSCEKKTNAQHVEEQQSVAVTPSGNTVITRFHVPKGFHLVAGEPESFAYFLQNLPLKPEEELVTYYNGKKKQRGNVYQAVVDLPIGSRDLHQCADAVIRLRADYLKSVGREDEIAFHFTNGFLCDYKTWKNGKRLNVEGNAVTWAEGNAHKDDYWKYLEMVFSYAGTLSLDKELIAKAITEIEIGDVFIQGGSPGHAIIVVNLAVGENGEKKIMLAQSYMPAQELQILNNPKNHTVWFDVPESGVLQTPEWRFEITDLKSF